MKKSNNADAETDFEQFAKLIQTIQKDSDIKSRMIQILKMDSYRRRFLLNNWLEKLRRKKAPENLRQALSCLFDDIISEKVLTLINDSLIKKKGHNN